MVAGHLDYTCIGNRVCRIILPIGSHGRSSVNKSSGKDWDQIWAGANIATMVAGVEPYGNIKNGALAVKGDRIAWIGPAAEGLREAAAFGIPIHDAQGLWLTPG